MSQPLRRLSRFILAFLLLGATSLANAAELNVSSNQLPVNLGPYLDYVADPDISMRIEDVVRPGIDWQRSTQAVPTLGMSSPSYWFSLVLTSTDLAGAELLLALDAPSLDLVEFYIAIDGVVVRREIMGDSVLTGSLSHPYHIPIMPFTMAEAGGETQIYFRAQSRIGIEIPLQLTTGELLAQDSQFYLPFLGGFFAFFLFCFLLCTTLYVVMKERQFIGFALFFGSALLFFLAQTGMGRVWLWGNVLEMNNRISLLAGTGLIASFCLIGQALNLEHKYRDQAVVVLRFLALVMIPAALYFLFVPVEQVSAGPIRTMMGIGLLVALTVLGMTIFAALQGSRSAVYLVGSWLLIVLAYTSYLLSKLEVVERSELSSLVGESMVVLAAMMVLFSLTEFVRSKNEEFVQARLETKAKGDFLRNVSREFLTPVHLILANSKRLLAAQSRNLDEGTRQHMTTVIKQSDHLHNLINDLLEMAELESESFEPEFELIEMTHFLNEVRDMMLPSALEKGLELSTDFASANLLVQTDKSRLQHALVNIITNAIKFTEKGNILLGYKAVYFKRRLGIEIFIRDTGKGMSEEFQQRMFQEFAREEPGSEKDPQGTGLGMVIVKRMIEKLGGEISFESVKDRGSEFFIRLPLRENLS
ncbi:MAG: sensor histidine kinase [Proteobacteria bacterium]|nr:sensor histidine kinase [Pseudomonadota bacterium]MDA0928832.1 sensor histidine kinase [Pseudomonadota bacterium]